MRNHNFNLKEQNQGIWEMEGYLEIIWIDQVLTMCLDCARPPGVRHGLPQRRD